jgi:hypothetical protein
VLDTEPKLLLEPEAIRGTWQSLVEKSNKREEHLRRHETIDMAILLKVESLALREGREDAIHELRDLLLLTHLVFIIDASPFLRGVHPLALDVQGIINRIALIHVTERV